MGGGHGGWSWGVVMGTQGSLAEPEAASGKQAGPASVTQQGQCCQPTVPHSPPSPCPPRPTPPTRGHKPPQAPARSPAEPSGCSGPRGPVRGRSDMSGGHRGWWLCPLHSLGLQSPLARGRPPALFRDKEGVRSRGWRSERPLMLQVIGGGEWGLPAPAPGALVVSRGCGWAHTAAVRGGGPGPRDSQRGKQNGPQAPQRGTWVPLPHPGVRERATLMPASPGDPWAAPALAASAASRRRESLCSEGGEIPGSLGHDKEPGLF